MFKRKDILDIINERYPEPDYDDMIDMEDFDSEDFDNDANDLFDSDAIE